MPLPCLRSEAIAVAAASEPGVGELALHAIGARDQVERAGGTCASCMTGIQLEMVAPVAYERPRIALLGHGSVASACPMRNHDDRHWLSGGAWLIMSELLRFSSGDGSAVLVEVAELPGGAVTRGGRVEAAVIEARDSLESLLGRLGPVVKGIVSELRASAEWPDELEIEFAVKVSADSNVIIARAGGEANFRITLRWSGEPSN
jgi:hypothetical protein